MLSVTWDDVRARRLARSSLVDRVGSDRLVDVAHELGGVHAQVQPSAELQLAARVEGITRDDVRDALWRRRSLVKAWTLRGTLHLPAAQDLALWHAAGRPGGRMSDDRQDGLEAGRAPAGGLHPPLGANDVK